MLRLKLTHYTYSRIQLYAEFLISVNVYVHYAAWDVLLRLRAFVGSWRGPTKYSALLIESDSKMSN